MIGVLARRATAGLFEDAVYPAGRLNAVAVNGLPGAATYRGAFFFRSDGFAYASIRLPFTITDVLPAEPTVYRRFASTTWFLYQDANGSSFHTADYATAPANLRTPTAQEIAYFGGSPPSGFKVYDQNIVSSLVEVRNGVIVNKTDTLTQVMICATRDASRVPGPSDYYYRRSQTGAKVLAGFVVNGQPVHATAPANASIGQGGQGSYPTRQLNATVGSFNIRISYTLNATASGPTLVTNVLQFGLPGTLVSPAGAAFIDLGRPLTESELSISGERRFYSL